MPDNDDKLKEILKENIENDLQRQYNLGLIAGFHAAYATLYEEIKDIHNIKDMKRVIKSKCDYTKEILNKSITENR